MRQEGVDLYGGGEEESSEIRNKIIIILLNRVFKGSLTSLLPHFTKYPPPTQLNLNSHPPTTADVMQIPWQPK